MLLHSNVQSDSNALTLQFAIITNVCSFKKKCIASLDHGPEIISEKIKKKLSFLDFTDII
jgi:hypothetical protein